MREVITGHLYCDDCYDDLKDPYDFDFAQMAVVSRVEHGTCTCCGYVVSSTELSYPEEVQAA